MLQKARSPKELQIGENLVKADLNAPEGLVGFLQAVQADGRGFQVPFYGKE